VLLVFLGASLDNSSLACARGGQDRGRSYSLPLCLYQGVSPGTFPLKQTGTGAISCIREHDPTDTNHEVLPSFSHSSREICQPPHWLPIFSICSRCVCVLVRICFTICLFISPDLDGNRGTTKMCPERPTKDLDGNRGTKNEAIPRSEVWCVVSSLLHKPSTVFFPGFSRARRIHH
jgi:hypothetical protein